MKLLSTKSYIICFKRPTGPDYELKMKHTHCEPRAPLHSAIYRNSRKFKKKIGRLLITQFQHLLKDGLRQYGIAIRSHICITR